MHRALTEADALTVLVYPGYHSLTHIKKKTPLQEPTETLTPYIFASFQH